MGTCVTFRAAAMSTAKSLNPYLNRTESSNSKRVPDMIPRFPANSNTHITEDSLPNISQFRTRSTTKQLNHCLENQQGYSLKYTNTGKRSCHVITDSSQDDYTDEHPYDIAPNRSSAFHITEDSTPKLKYTKHGETLMPRDYRIITGGLYR